MSPWFLDFFAGLILALLFYGLVCLRMLVGPMMYHRYGPWARWTAWIIVGLLMIVAANLMLLALRFLLHDQFPLIPPFFHELLFATIAFGGGFFLVAWHVTRQRRNNPQANSDCRKVR